MCGGGWLGPQTLLHKFMCGKKNRTRHKDQDDGKERDFKGGTLRDSFGGFDGFGGAGQHLALLLLVLQNTGPRGNRDGLGGFGSYGGFGHDGYPLLNWEEKKPVLKSQNSARLCGRFHLVKSLLKNPHTEPLQNSESQAQLSDPASSSPINLSTLLQHPENRAFLKGERGGPERGGFCTRVRSTMSARGVQRETVVEYQNVSNICVAVRWRCTGHRGQSIIVPSSSEACDCRSPYLAFPRLAVAGFKRLRCQCRSPKDG